MLNVYNLANQIIGIIHPNVEITCRKFVSATTNDMGVVQPVWNVFNVEAQVQPQTANDIKNQLNMDVSELKMNVWIKAELHSVETQQVADQVVYNDRVWNVVTVTNWMPGNGWGNYVIAENKFVDPSTDETKGEKSTKKDDLVW